MISKYTLLLAACFVLCGVKAQSNEACGKDAGIQAKFLSDQPKDSSKTQELTKAITDGKYDNAVKLSQDLFKAGNGAVITNVVKKLCEQREKNLLNFVYQLYKKDPKIVAERLPRSFFSLFSYEDITLINKIRGLALKLDSNVDSYGDRIGWGAATDKTSRRVIWKMIALWQNNKVYFRIMNTFYNFYLKLDSNVDSYGDRQGYGAEKGQKEERRLWSLVPSLIDGEVHFNIINKQYNMHLKLDANVDSYNDRKLWGAKYEPNSDAAYYGWTVKKHCPSGN